MAGKSVYNEEGLLNVLRGTTYPLASTGSVYIALYTAAPTDAGGGTEVAAGGYARQAVSKATGSWSAPSGTPRAMTNSAIITFGPATASWGTVTHVGVFDALTVGNLLYWAALGTSKLVGNSDSAQFAVAGLSLSED